MEIKDDLISRKDALSAIDGICATNERELVIKSLAHTMLLSKSMVPTIEAAPVVHARWVGYDDNYGVVCECSECHFVDNIHAGENYWFNRQYCPNCGAKMDGGDIAHG